MRKGYYSVRNQTPNEAEFYLYEEIGFEGWDGDGITAKKIAEDLQAAGNLQKINLHINSPGGRVFEAVAIYNLFRMHKAQVNVSIEGLAASSASIVAMCGDTIEAAANSLILIHDPWSMAVGTADDFEKEADMLRKVKGTIITTYLSQCRKSGSKTTEKQLADMMSQETWMNADEALGFGLIDSVTEALQAAACFDLSKFKYRKAPAAPKQDPLAFRTRIASMAMDCRRLRLAAH